MQEPPPDDQFSLLQQLNLEPFFYSRGLRWSSGIRCSSSFLCMLGVAAPVGHGTCAAGATVDGARSMAGTAGNVGAITTMRRPT
ncbi:hypothetical protein [Luteimonas salinilitoris]|uniref:Uncharacterized protein n=1 Tax=Luteimonas salinilitoris TaxID=3237697 RepID=A0ABV4HPB2_9GAMM